MKERQLYYIENIGCDDTTRSLMELTQEEFYLMEEFVISNNANSSHSCQPVIRMYQINWDDLEIAENKDESYYYDTFWYANIKYALKDYWLTVVKEKQVV